METTETLESYYDTGDEYLELNLRLYYMVDDFTELLRSSNGYDRTEESAER